MKVRILGCSGGIGGDLHTTSLLLDHDVLIDAGTGVCVLSVAELAQIDHIFITHSHLDHVASVPFLLDTVFPMREKPVTLHGTAETLAILQEHLFNWKLWPDFTTIPDPANPALRYDVIQVGSPCLLGSRKIIPVPANHVVPAVGYHLDSGAASLVYTGDTTTNDDLWQVVNQIANLRYLVIETALPDGDRPLAALSKHLCPSLLAEELEKLQLFPELYITHLKPRESHIIMSEIAAQVRNRRVHMLRNNQVFHL